MSIRINGKKYINGTVVRANPVEEATGTLEKIGIGSDVYNIAGGGGGGTSGGSAYTETVLWENASGITFYPQSPQTITLSESIDKFDALLFDISTTESLDYHSSFITPVSAIYRDGTTMSGANGISEQYTFSFKYSDTTHLILWGWASSYKLKGYKVTGIKYGGNLSPIIYSTEEREIGVWTDNKPLYQKTVIKSGTISQRETISLGIANVENIFLVSDASNVNNGQTPLPLVTGTDNSNNTGGFFDIQQSDTSFLFRIGSGMVGYVENAIITVRYTKTTDIAGSGSYNTLRVPTVHYATDEQVIGTWVDGKPLYEKTIVTTSPSSTGSSDLVTLTNVDIIVKLSGIIKTTGNITTESNNAFLLWYRTASHPTNKNKIAINLQNSDYINSPLYVTVQYTKTTD